MKKIKQLVKHIKCELDDAEEYVQQAILYLSEDKPLAEMYLNLAKDELRHKDAEHDHVIRLIKDYESANGSAPATMKAIWDWEHQQLIERQSGIRAMMAMYK